MTSPLAHPPSWQLAHARTIPLDRPRLMAIINLTPDSFHAGARFQDPGAAVEHAHRAVAEGADLLDAGAESTRPGAARIDAPEQLRRLQPFLGALRSSRGPAASVPVSIDTTRSEVAGACLDAGADAINDVSAGTEDPRMLPLVARWGAGVVLMHRLKPPAQDSYSDRYAEPPRYADVVVTVRDWLAERCRAATEAGVDPRSIAVDPGLGFGKTVEQNVALIRGTGAIVELGYPVVSALSRKSFVGRVYLGRDSTPEERLEGTLALSLEHRRAGAMVFRVHDVDAHRRLLAGTQAAGHGRTGRAPNQE